MMLFFLWERGGEILAVERQSRAEVGHTATI